MVMLFSALYFKKEVQCLIGEAEYASLKAIPSIVNARILFYAIFVWLFDIPMFLNLQGG